MRITRTKLEKMIAEEVRLGLSQLRERSTDKKKSKGPKEPEMADADQSPTKAQDGAPDGVRPDSRKKDALPVGTNPLDVDGMDDADPGPTDPEEEDEGAEDEADAVDAMGDADSDPSGEVNEELSGKTVQAITIEPKSKVLPGAKEVVLAFNETTDALRILVTPTGKVVFFYRGKMHDLP
jgi:hypothetical protein